MSQENVPRDRRAQADALFAALNARDFEAIGELPMHPDMEFRSAFAAVEGGTYHGIQGLREWAQNMDSLFEGFRTELLEFREVDEDRALLVVRVVGRARASGLPVDALTAQVWTWRNGLGWRNETYTDVREALEAVGLSE